MRIKLHRALYARAGACADAVETPLGQWIAAAVRHAQRGTLDGVAAEPNLLVATRKAICTTIPDLPLPPGAIREAVSRAVLYAEARAPARFTTELQPGKDYTLAPEGVW